MPCYRPSWITNFNREPRLMNQPGPKSMRANDRPIMSSIIISICAVCLCPRRTRRVPRPWRSVGAWSRTRHVSPLENANRTRVLRFSAEIRSRARSLMNPRADVEVPAACSATAVSRLLASTGIRSSPRCTVVALIPVRESAALSGVRVSPDVDSVLDNGSIAAIPT